MCWRCWGATLSWGALVLWGGEGHRQLPAQGVCGGVRVPQAHLWLSSTPDGSHGHHGRWSRAPGWMWGPGCWFAASAPLPPLQEGPPWARLPCATLLLATHHGMSPAPAHSWVGSTVVWGQGCWCPLHPAAMAPGTEPEASSRFASPIPTTYPSSAARWPWAPPAAQRAGPPSPRSQCWAVAPPARATSAQHPGPPCACPAL